MLPDLPLTEAPDLISIGAQSLADNASRLGLTWRLRPATVISSAGNTITAIYDGDTTPLSMVSLIGLIPFGTRVYGMSVPPAGEFIIGFTGATHLGLYGESADVDLTFASATAFTQAISFTTPFAVVPFVVANINSASNQTTGWAVRCQTITTTGFNMTVSTAGAANTWSPARRVQWQAIARQV